MKLGIDVERSQKSKGYLLLFQFHAIDVGENYWTYKISIYHTNVKVLCIENVSLYIQIFVVSKYSLIIQMIVEHSK